MKVVAQFEYRGGDGIAVGICKKAPKEARTKADVIALIVVKKKKKRVVQSEINYFTPDEANCISLGLHRAVDEVMRSRFIDFRDEKDKLGRYKKRKFK